MNSLVKRIETIANLAIIVVAILLCYVLVRSYIFRKTPAAQPATASALQPGTKLSLSGVDWKTNGKTLVLALSTQCHFCSESAPFYKQLSQNRDNKVKLVAVFPQPISEAQSYLRNLGISTDDVRESQLAALKVTATPTLILIDNEGTVTNSWLGKLPPDKENEVLSKLK